MAKITEARKLIRDARKAATFELARFTDGDTDSIREATRIYRESWIIPQLDHALGLLGETITDCEWCGRSHNES